MPFGLAAVDAALPCGGLAPGALHQIVGAGAGGAGGVPGFVLRRWRTAGTAAAQHAAPSAAVTRWRVAAAPSRAIREPGIGIPLWRVELVRCRGGSPATWLMEESDATGHVALAAELADRPAAIAALRAV